MWSRYQVESQCFSQSETDLEEETKNFSSKMLSSGFLVIHNASRSGQDDVTELSTWQQVCGPFFDISNSNIESWGDDSAFVESSSQIDDNFSGSVVINNLEFSDVTMLHHHSQESDDNFGARSDEHLPLSSLFSVVDAF